MAKEYDVEKKEREISNDEFTNVLQKGDGIITRRIISADGTEQEEAIWGGYKFDGYDRTLNIFMKYDVIMHFCQLILDNKLDNIKAKDPCKLEEGYQINIDFIDKPLSSILRMGKEKFELKTYVRDDKKTFSDLELVDTCSGETNIESDGTPNFSAFESDDDKKMFIVMAFAYTGLRKYLLKEGIVQELYRMYDETAGVIVKVGKTGKVSCNIVKGMQRPDLPCHVALLGEIICRPYIDELLGIKSTGEKRQPRNPELAAQIKEQEKQREKELAAQKAKEAERKAKEEAERKAREEAKAAEEKARIEAQKREEERRKKEVENAQKEWEEKVQQIKKTRELELQNKLASIEDEKNKSLEKAENEKNIAIEECDKKINKKNVSITNMNQELASAFFLNFRKKKKLKNSILYAQSSLSNFKEEKDCIISNYDKKVDEIKHKAVRANEVAKSEIERKYPIPESPEEKERKRKAAEEAERQRKAEEERRREEVKRFGKEEARRRAADREYTDKVRKALANDPMTPSELMVAIGAPNTQKVALIVKEMPEVDRVVSGKKVYYKL